VPAGEQDLPRGRADTRPHQVDRGRGQVARHHARVRNARGPRLARLRGPSAIGSRPDRRGCRFCYSHRSRAPSGAFRIARGSGGRYAPAAPGSPPLHSRFPAARAPAA
jgi:hypothetical protein